MTAEDYLNAIKTYNAASNLNPDFADLYYSRAVCEENLAKDIISGELLVEDNGTIVKNDKKYEKEDSTVANSSKLSGIAVKTVLDSIDSAAADYQIYIDKSQNASDKEEINNKLEELKKLAESYAK